VEKNLNRGGMFSSLSSLFSAVKPDLAASFQFRLFI